jgi:hypothetical protein
MIESDQSMVLKSVYLPHAVDGELRQVAVTLDASEAGLTNDLIIKGLIQICESDQRTFTRQSFQAAFKLGWFA